MRLNLFLSENQPIGEHFGETDKFLLSVGDPSVRNWAIEKILTDPLIAYKTENILNYLKMNTNHI